MPIDSETPLISGNLVPRDAVLMAANVLMATHNFVQAALPARWRQAFEAHWLSPEPSVVFGDCVETVHLSNQLALALNTSEEAIALLNDQWNNSDTVASRLAWLAAFVSSSLSSTPPGYTADANAGQVVTLTAASTAIDDVLFQGGLVRWRSPQTSHTPFCSSSLTRSRGSVPCLALAGAGWQRFRKHRRSHQALSEWWAR